MRQGCGLASWAVVLTRAGVSPVRGPPCRYPCDTHAEGITMTTTSLASSVHPLLPYEVQPGRLLLASGVRAGDWIFASGLLRPRFGATARPLSGDPAWTIQCRSVWERAQAVLAAGGTDLAHLVRCDQFLPDWRAMPFLHAVRREVCGAHIPPS